MGREKGTDTGEKGLVAVEAESGVMSLQNVYKRGVQLGSQLKDPSLIKLHGRPLPPKSWSYVFAVKAAQRRVLCRSTPGTYTTDPLPEGLFPGLWLLSWK